MIKELQEDKTVPKEATNLVYLSVADSRRYIDSNIVYSIFKKRPKRADVYWFVHVETVDDPFTSKYLVDTIIPMRAFFIRIKLGFKAPHRVNTVFNKIIHDMADAGEINLTSPYPSLHKYSMMADFKYISIHSWASADSEISSFDRFVLAGYRFIKSFSLSTKRCMALRRQTLKSKECRSRLVPWPK